MLKELNQMDPLMRLEGRDFYGYVIELYEDRLKIKYSEKKLHDIPLKSIVEIRKTNVSFIMIWGGLNVLSKDNNGKIQNDWILFNKNSADAGEKLRLMLEDLRNGKRPQAPVSQGTQASSNMVELEKLADLKAKGIITEDEFQAKKQQLLFGNTGGPVLRETIIKEIVKVPCAYCGLLVDVTSARCPGCGAPVNRR